MLLRAFLAAAALLIVVAPPVSASWEESPARLVFLRETVPGTPGEFIRDLRDQGAHASVIVPGSAAIVYADQSVLDSSALRAWIESVQAGEIEDTVLASLAPRHQRMGRVWNRIRAMRAAADASGIEAAHGHAGSPGRRIPVPLQPRTFAPRDSYDHIPYGAQYLDTGTYLAGSTSVGVWLLEASGSTYDWTQTEEDETLAGIASGFDKWVIDHGGAMAFLTFVLEIHTGVPVSGVPIENPQSDEWIWIEEVMANEGYTSGNAWDRCFAYNNDIRNTFETNWCYSLFIVDSDPDVNQGLFSGGGYAWAYYGGPWIYMSRYSTWAFNSQNYHEAVPMHEMGHIFFATDEYDEFQQWSGYLNRTDNSGAICLMNQNVDTRICRQSQNQLGWRDSDDDGVMETMDVAPGSPLDEALPDPTSNPTPTWTGTASVNTLTNQNPNAPYFPPHDIMVATIANVECRVDGGAWSAATAADGSFDAYVEDFSWLSPPLADGVHVVEARAQTSVGVWSDVFGTDTITIEGTAVGVGLASSSVDSFRLLPVRPNPVRGEARIEFTIPSAGDVRVAIYSVDGALVRTVHDGVHSAGIGSLNWDGRDAQGHVLPAGTFFLRLEWEGGSATRTFTRIR